MTKEAHDEWVQSHYRIENEVAELQKRADAALYKAIMQFQEALEGLTGEMEGASEAINDLLFVMRHKMAADAQFPGNNANFEKRGR